MRVIEHVEGYGVPDHAHTVLFPAARGEGRRLYDPSNLPPADVLAAELDEMQARYTITGTDLAAVSLRLQAEQTIAPITDLQWNQHELSGLSHSLSALSQRIQTTVDHMQLST